MIQYYYQCQMKQIYDDKPVAIYNSLSYKATKARNI